MAPTYIENKLTQGIANRIYPANIIKKDIAPEIKFHERALDIQQSLLAVKGKKDIKVRPTDSIKFWSYESEPFGQWFYLSAAINNSTTTIPIDDGAGTGISFLKPGDLIQLVKSDFTAIETMRIATAAAGVLTSLIVDTRPIGTTAYSWADNTPARLIGRAEIEDSVTPGIKSILPGEEYNYCTQIRTSMGGTYRFLDSKMLIGGTPKEQLRLNAWLQHLNKKIKMLLFAERYAETTYGVTVGEGIVPAIIRRGGQFDPINGVISFDRFLETMSTAFLVGGTQKIGLFCPMMLQALSYWKLKNLVVMQDEEFMNLRVKRLQLAEGDITIFRERNFQGNPGNLKGLFGSSFVILDPDNLYYRNFGDWDEKFLLDTGAKGTLGEIDEYISDFGIQMDVAPSHTLATGVTGYN